MADTPKPLEMNRIASPIQEIKDHYEALVIGTGYGGGISASRLARAGLSVAVLERGREILPGEYPDTEAEQAIETQMNMPEGHVGSRTALYEYHVDDAMTTLVGVGLGGGSLINANVAVRVDRRVFDDPRWPEAFRVDVDTLLEESYARAEQMLGSNPYPDGFPTLPKMEAMRKSADSMNAPFVKLPINVTFDTTVNQAGIEQPGCALCGDCMAGCNYGSKNTIRMNYLPDAYNHGAEIFCQVDVRFLERRADRWVIHFQPLGTGAERFDAPTQTVSADVVVLAAGTYGSTQILLRSREKGLSLSNQLGEHFSGNGDVGGMAYNCDDEIRGVGVGFKLDRVKGAVGPTISSAIDLRETMADFERGMLIEEGALHSPIAGLMPNALSLIAKTTGIDTDRGLADSVQEKARELEGLVRGPYHGAVQHSLIYLVMAHDGSDGHLKLVNDHPRVDWPEVGGRPFVKHVNDQLLAATRALGGTFTENPAWSLLPKKNMVTAHPLGGCAMGEDAGQGVVNHKGQVFAGASGTAVHNGLYVSDGSVLPRSIGANPLLTISAVTERAMALLAEDRGLTIDYSVKPYAPAQGKEPAIGIQFSETMGGYFTLGAEDFQEGWDKGKAAGSEFRFVLTILIADLEAMIADPDYTSPATGTVEAPSLSAEPLTVTEGRFNLAVTDPNDPAKLRRMKYNMKLTDQDGRVYYFYGYKLVRGEKHGLDLWPDTTTLYITVYDGEDADAPELGKGILRIYPNDFRKQILSTQVIGAKGLAQRLSAMAQFGRFFASTLFDVYGGVFARRTLFDPTAPPRKKRPLRAPAPEVHGVLTEDDKTLRLTRYQGGNKGPVMLVHGLGVSSLAFALDTIDTNLTEFLCAHGYDVWLLDMRSSIELPYADTPYTCDDIARYDYPAAVDTIRAVTGAPDIQVLGHCYGSMSFHMAMLNGLQGVRSAVASQVGAHINVIAANKAKSLLHLDDVLKGLGIKNLTMRTDAGDGWLDRLYNRALAFNPVIAAEEVCDNPVCHRITFLYAPLYEHDQLNNATHAIMHELFGVASIENFAHLSKMSRAGHLTDADGKDVYLPHVERLNIPIAYIHGAENETWLPESTERTYKWLIENNPRGEYSRHVIPLYGHIDCIFGKDAVRDVYPLILLHLEKTA